MNERKKEEGKNERKKDDRASHNLKFLPPLFCLFICLLISFVFVFFPPCSRPGDVRGGVSQSASSVSKEVKMSTKTVKAGTGWRPHEPKKREKKNKQGVNDAVNGEQ